MHNYVTIVADVMFVLKTSFLITMSCDIIFITAEHVPTHTDKHLSKNLKIVINLYAHGSMAVQTMLTNMEFNKTDDNMMD